MSASSNDSIDDGQGALRESPPEPALDLPVEPGYCDLPPKGSWEAGYRLSLSALETVKHRPEIWSQRDALRCRVEFQL